MKILTLSIYVTLPLSFALQLATAVLIVRRKQLRTFPVFFAYTIFHLIQAVLSFAAFRISYTFYFYEWWTGELVDAVVSLAVIQELFLVTFQPYGALRRWGSRLYVIAAILLCFVTLILSLERSQGETLRVIVLFALDRASNFVQVGLLFFLFLFCRLFGMTWRHYVFGIATGFVLTASMVGTAAAIRSHFGPQANTWSLILEPVGFTLGVLVWTFYFASAQSRVPLDHVPGTERLIAWNQALGEIGRR